MISKLCLVIIVARENTNFTLVFDTEQRLLRAINPHVNPCRVLEVPGGATRRLAAVARQNYDRGD